MASDDLKARARQELLRRKAQAELDRRKTQTDQGGGVADTVDAFGRGVANMGSLGFIDEIGAGARYLGGKVFPWQPELTYDEALAEVRGDDRRLAEEHPVADIAGNVTGALGLPMKAAGSALGAVGQGAAVGGLYGFGSGEGGFENRRDDAAISALIGGAAGGLVHKGFERLANRAASKTIPSADEVRAIGDAAYKAADDAGVIFTPSATDRLRQQIFDKLTDMGYDPALQPGAGAVVRRLEDLQGQNVTLKGLDTVRKVAGNGFIVGNKSNNKAVTKIIDRIDDLVANPAADDVLTGNAEAGADALRTARDMWSRLSKSDRVNTAVRMAEGRAASTGSGGNVDNATRQNLRRILEKPRGFTPAEQDALKTAVQGTATQNALRLAGKLSPSGNGLMAALGIGGTMVNPAVGALSLGGMAAKGVADSMTKKNVAKLTELILTGGQTSKEIAKLASKGIGKKELVDAITRLQLAEGFAAPAASRGSVGLRDYMAH